MNLLNPLEQFEIFPLFFIFINNVFLILLLLSIILYIVYFYITHSSVVTTRLNLILESLYLVCFELVFSNIGSRGIKFLPLIFTVFVFILGCNLIGMIPYSFTVTSHLIVTFSLAFMLYFGLNYIGISQHGLQFLTLLLPSGISIYLVPLLVPIEFISYIFKLVSLPVRLFANMMAGHTLIKVIAGFAWAMSNAGGVALVAHFIPLFLIILLIGLEFGVALIQAYVFTTLVCIYLADAINLH